jgi:triosephosphate isomerase
MRKKIIAGNWKMNKSFDEGMALVSELSNMIKDEYHGSAEVVIIPPSLYINSISRMTADFANISTGAQNCSNHSSGAYTGEISASMVKSCGGKYIIIATRHIITNSRHETVIEVATDSSRNDKQQVSSVEQNNTAVAYGT